MAANLIAKLSDELPDFDPAMAPGLEGGVQVQINPELNVDGSPGAPAKVSIFTPPDAAAGVAARSPPATVGAPPGKPSTLGEAFEPLNFPRGFAGPLSWFGWRRC